MVFICCVKEELLTNGIYPPDIFKNTIFGFLMIFSTLKYGEFPCVIYFSCLELSMLLFFITKLTV